MTTEPTLDAHAAAGAADSGGDLPPRQPGMVQVAFALLHEWRPWRARMDAWLGDDERARIARKRRPQDREDLALAYGLHRLFIGRLHGLAPADVPMARDAEGRPVLHGLAGGTSLSHAQDAAAFAFAGDAVVGVDVEPASRGAVMDEIAAQVAHAEERVALAALPEARRSRHALDLWVRKEAFLKAVGIGLACEMSAFRMDEVTDSRVAGDRDAGLLRTRALPLHPAFVVAVSARPEAGVAATWWRPR